MEILPSPRGCRHIAEPRKSVCDLCLVIFWLFIHCYGRSLLGLPLYSVDCEERYSRKGVDRGFSDCRISQQLVSEQWLARVQPRLPSSRWRSLMEGQLSVVEDAGDVTSGERGDS